MPNALRLKDGEGPYTLRVVAGGAWLGMQSYPWNANDGAPRLAGSRRPVHSCYAR
jgi:hypothetical protein